MNNLKILNINCRSVANKKVELDNLIHSTNADIVLGTESWLNSSIRSSEIFPANMNVFRRDKLGSNGGGVFIAISDKYIVSHQPQLETNCEITWVKLETPGNKSKYIGVFYRAHENDSDSLDNLSASLEKLKNTNSNIYIEGDFNKPGIDWNVGITKINSGFKIQHNRFLEILNDNNLCQIVKEPTRGSNFLICSSQTIHHL